ncbi:hypothetical protein RB595_001104 [Gaeumannomyces hyphopodioides]
MSTADPPWRGLLAEVPEDVLFSILAHLETARDVASLAGTCTRLARLVRDNGWRIFARTRFPSLAVPQERVLRNPELTWAMVSESLTWQSRCWDRRSLTLTATTQRRHARGHQYHCPSVVDAHFDLDTRSELLVWSEGESFCARRREIVDDGWSETHHFSRFAGSMRGFVPGKDDVMQLSVVANLQGAAGRQGVLSLRASGRLDLLAAGHDGFGTLLASFDQSSLVSMDVSHKGSIAACNKDSLFLYQLPQDRDQPPEVGPYLACWLKELLLDKTDTTYLGGVKWIGNDDTLALGVKGQYTSQLQYLQLTPTGAVQVHRAVEHPGAGAAALRRQISASSITPVDPPSPGGRAGRPLVLAAYSDGTVRLQDLRSPTPFDAVYEDNVNPGSAFEHLLAWGGERFVAGGSADAILRVFDLRWPRPYHHQRALPCRSALPYPDPPQPFASPRRRRRLLDDPPRIARCDASAAVECTWHRLSRDIYHRPNCNLYYHRRDRDRRRGARPADPPSCVRSLAKGSDLSPHFFVGVPGGFLEARLGTGGRDGGGGGGGGGGDPHLSFELLDLPAGGDGDGDQSGGGGSGSSSSGYETAELRTFVMETGDGLSVPHNDRTIALPPFRLDAKRRVKKGHVPQELQDSHRLDPRYHHATDFGQFLTWNDSYGTVAE